MSGRRRWGRGGTGGPGTPPFPDACLYARRAAGASSAGRRAEPNEVSSGVPARKGRAGTAAPFLESGGEKRRETGRALPGRPRTQSRGVAGGRLCRDPPPHLRAWPRGKDNSAPRGRSRQVSAGSPRAPPAGLALQYLCAREGVSMCFKKTRRRGPNTRSRRFQAAPCPRAVGTAGARGGGRVGRERPVPAAQPAGGTSCALPHDAVATWVLCTQLLSSKQMRSGVRVLSLLAKQEISPQNKSKVYSAACH